MKEVGMEHDLKPPNEALGILKEPFLETFLKKMKEIEEEFVKIVEETRKKAIEEKKKGAPKDEESKVENEANIAA